MANKRYLKKHIRYVCGDIAAECIMARHYIDDIDAAKMNEIVIDIARLQENALERVTVAFDRVPAGYDNKAQYNKERRAYMAHAYKSLEAEFNQSIKEIVKRMNTALSDEQKAANVEALKK